MALLDISDFFFVDYHDSILAVIRSLHFAFEKTKFRGEGKRGEKKSGIVIKLSLLIIINKEIAGGLVCDSTISIDKT